MAGISFSDMEQQGVYRGLPSIEQPQLFKAAGREFLEKI